MAPARVLSRELQHNPANLRRQARLSALAGRLSPLPANEPLMPAQKRPRCHQKHASRRARQVAGRGRQQGPIHRPEFRPHDLPAPGSRARAAAPTARRLSHANRDGYEQARRARPAQRGRETRKPCRRYSQPSPQEEATDILAPFRGLPKSQSDPQGQPSQSSVMGRAPGFEGKARRRLG
jgi:hypothetical protein